MKKIRNCTTRTRGGCATCKRRRRKCDERRPACINCTSSGRTCEGFADPFRTVSKPTGVGSVVSIPASLTVGDANMPRIASFQHLADAIFGHLNQTLVHEILKRASSQTVVQNALFALSVQLEAFACDHRNRDVNHTDGQFSLRHYGRSLRGVQDALNDETKPGRRVETLLALSLVISYELLRGNGLAALAHLQGALHLLAASLMTAALNHEDLAILEMATLFYLQLEVGALSFAGALSPTMSTAVFDQISSNADREASLLTTSGVASLQALRAKFLCLKFRGLQALNHSKTESSAVHVQGQDTHGTHSALTVLFDLKLWFQLFQPALDAVNSRYSTPSSMVAQTFKQCQVLYIHYLTLTMRLSSFCSEARETAFDSFETCFDAIVSHAEKLISQGQHLHFTLDMGLVEPLYFTILKCREPDKRLAALKLLNLCRQEGAWDGPLMASIAQQAIRVEAALCGFEQYGEEELASGTISLPDCAQVIWNMREDINAERCRVFAVSLPSIDWEHRSALVEFHHHHGTASAICSI